MAKAKAITQGLASAAKQHLLGGDPLTRLEALVLYGVANLPDVIKEMRKQGFMVNSKAVPYAAALVRLNKVATVKPPDNLPVREIHLTEYRISR